MRSIVLLALVALAAAVPQVPKQRAADQDLLKKQQDVIGLLEYITENIRDEQLGHLGETYDIENNYHLYEEPNVVKYYVGAVTTGNVQPRGTVFSSSIHQLRKEIALLSRMFLGAKDYGTFLKTAAWARIHVNEQQFVKAFTYAILQRQDTQGIILPAPYEIFPWYYLDSRVIQHVKNIQTHGVETTTLPSGIQTVIVPVNYTAYLPHGEHQLEHFTQDIGLAAYYAYIQLAGYMVPTQGHHQQQQSGIWGQQTGEQTHIGHGSHYYYLHQQLLAQYHLERLGHGLGPIHETDFESIEIPYQPRLSYPNGLQFPGRAEELQLFQQKRRLYQSVTVLLKRLIDAIDAGHVVTPQGQFLSLYQPQGLDILGELIEGTGRSVNPRYYGSYQAAARQLLGNAPDVQDIFGYTPSVLELGQTAVKDPAFYSLWKNILHLFHHYQQSLPAYQYNDVVLPGVKIEKVDVSRLVTYFDDFLVNLDNVQGQYHQQQQQNEYVHVHAAVKRLNHKPYEYKIIVQSENNINNAVVRVYLGPKYNHNGQPININEDRLHFVELDQFVHDLQQGQNVITRHSGQAPGQSFDHPTVNEIKNGIHGAINSQSPLYITEPQQIYGFPARLTLPKGQVNGYPLQLLIVISGPTGQENIAYGPVVPEQYQSYQQHQYQIVQPEDYQQYVHGQGPKVSGGYQTVEVLPNYYGGVAVHQTGHWQAGHLYQISPRQYPYPHPQYWYNVYGKQQQQVYPQQYQQGQNVHQGQSYPQVPGYQGQTYVTGQQQQQHVVGQMPYQQHVTGQYVHQPQYQQGHQQMHQQQQQGIVGGVEGVTGQYTGGKYHSIQHTGIYGQGVQGGVYSQGIYGGIYQGTQQTVPQGQYKSHEYLQNYFSQKHISEIIGGAISLDGRPLGYPLERPLAPSALHVGNIYVQDVAIYHEEQHHEVAYHTV